MTKAFEQHNHKACMSGTMSDVEAICDANSLRLTAVRRRVLEILLEAHRALGAYDILGRLSDEGLGSQPPVVYRALEFLMEHGFVHKLQRLNAYVACVHPDDEHNPVFMICTKCASVAEADSQKSASALDATAGQMGFRIERIVIEAEGICPACAKGAS